MRIDEITGIHYYEEGDTLSDLIFNGESVISLQPVGAQFNPITGYGYVVLLRPLDKPNVAAKTMIDGQKLTHTYYGTVSVVA